MQNLTKTIAVLILSIALVCTTGCKKHNSGNGTYKGRDYIDLGLPSGTMWATCNVGAENPEGYGDYFAWGKPNPKPSTPTATMFTATAVMTISQSIAQNQSLATMASPTT